MGYVAGTIYTPLILLGAIFASGLAKGPAADLSQNLIDTVVFAGAITLAAPLLALIVMPTLAVTAALACLVCAHVLAQHPELSAKARRLDLVGCGASTGLALWLVSLWAAGSELGFAGALWLVPAILAMLTVDWFLFAERRGRGYRVS